MDFNTLMTMLRNGLQGTSNNEPVPQMVSAPPIPASMPSILTSPIYWQMAYQHALLQQQQQQLQQQQQQNSQQQIQQQLASLLLNLSSAAAQGSATSNPLAALAAGIPVTLVLPDGLGSPASATCTPNPTPSTSTATSLECRAPRKSEKLHTPKRHENQELPKPTPFDADEASMPLPIQNFLTEDTKMAIFASLLTPDATPSPSEEASRPSPAASASTTRNSDDGDDDGLFIDVEDVEDKETGKNKRRAHIEFYRKLKGIRHRGEKRIPCARCDEVVENNDTALTEHVQEHTGGPSFRCQICGWQAESRTTMYAHMTDKHPKKPGAFSDRRDMARMIELVSECFPKGGVKTQRSSFSSYVENLSKELAGRSIDKLKCKLCEKTVSADKHAISRHIHSHPSYRCKTCKFTTDSVTTQAEHCTTLHQIENPLVTVHYNLCTAADALTRSFQKCFADVL